MAFDPLSLEDPETCWAHFAHTRIVPGCTSRLSAPSPSLTLRTSGWADSEGIAGLHVIGGWRYLLIQTVAFMWLFHMAHLSVEGNLCVDEEERDL